MSGDATTASICVSVPKPASVGFTRARLWFTVSTIILLSWWDYITNIIHHVHRMTFYIRKSCWTQADQISWLRWRSCGAIRERRISNECVCVWRLGFKATFTLDPSTPTDDISRRRNPHRQSQSQVYTAQDLFWAPEAACIYLSTNMLKDKCILLEELQHNSLCVSLLTEASTNS